MILFYFTNRLVMDHDNTRDDERTTTATTIIVTSTTMKVGNAEDVGKVDACARNIDLRSDMRSEVYIA
jgi:hypothetical protein